jgi:hypothetical protein
LDFRFWILDSEKKQTPIENLSLLPFCLMPAEDFALLLRRNDGRRRQKNCSQK